jgi:hypothetical protein
MRDALQPDVPPCRSCPVGASAAECSETAGHVSLAVVLRKLVPFRQQVHGGIRAARE